MTEQEKTTEIVFYWWSQANQSLISAQIQYKAGLYNFAINRLYYAVFYAASAALIERNYTFKKHTGVRSMFHKIFIKTGLLDVKWGKLYNQLFDDRHEGDYIALIKFSQRYVETQLMQCTQFLNELSPHISVLNKDTN